jgi:hypothetical protein
VGYPRLPEGEVRGALPAGRRGKYDPFGYQALAERYQQGTDAEAEVVVDVMVTLLLRGVREEQELAAGFLATHQPPPEVTRELVDAYLERSVEALGPLQRVLGSFAARPSDADLARLRTGFLSDPDTHWPLAELLLSRQPDIEVWAALAAAVEDLPPYPHLTTG